MVRLFVFHLLIFWPLASWAQSDDDDRAWSEALGEETPRAFQEYLEKYPKGSHTLAAFRCSVELKLMGANHTCSARNSPPGPLGPTRVQIGNFPVTIR